MFESAYAYGLRIQANKPLPGFTRATADFSPDLRLLLRQTPDWLKALLGAASKSKFICPETDDKGRPFFEVSELSRGEFYQLCYSDGAMFIVDRAGTRVWIEWPGTLSLEDISTYLYGPVIGWVLRLRGDVCLHASAVAVDGAAIAFVGPSGAGKSTAAAALAERGYAVLADDVAAIFGPSDSLFVRPSYPELRLWPASVAALFPPKNGRSIEPPLNEKLRLNLRANGQRFQDEPLPLAAVYILNDDNPAGHNEIRALTHRVAIMALIANTHAGRLLDQKGRRKEFDLLAALVASVRVREVCRSTDLAQLPQLCDAILSDFAERSGPAPIMEAASA